MSSVWDDYVRPSFIPPDSMLYMGCAHWTPDREGRQAPAVLAVPGRFEIQPRPACTICGGLVEEPDGSAYRPDGTSSDPIRVFETTVHVCGGCQRSAYDRQIARLPNRLYEPDPAVIGDGDEAVDKRDALDRTREAVTGRAVRLGKVQYLPGADERDHLSRLRKRPKAKAKSKVLARVGRR